MATYDHAIAILEAQRDELLRELSSGEGAALPRKVELDAAIRVLTLCSQHSVGPRATFTRLPQPETQTPSSEYRIVEDHESDDRKYWTEVEVNGEPVRPLPGALIVEAE